LEAPRPYIREFMGDDGCKGEGLFGAYSFVLELRMGKVSASNELLPDGLIGLYLLVGSGDRGSPVSLYEVL
jgi:hypothetical protein